MKNFRSSIKGVVDVYRLFRWRIVISVALGLMRVAASLVFVWVSKHLVDIVTGVIDDSLPAYIWMIVAVVLLQIALNVFSSYWENINLIKAKNELREKTFAHVLNSRWNGMEEYHSADVLNRIQEDIRVMIDLVCTRIPDIVVTACQLLAASVFLVMMAPGLLGLVMLLMVFSLLGSKMFYKTQRKLTERIRVLDSESQQYVQENLLNRALVLSLVGVEKVMSKFGLIQKDIEKESVSRLNYNTIARTFMGLGFMAGYTTAFLWGIYGIRDGSVTYGMMTAFLQLVGQVQRPLAELGRHVPAFIQALTSEERLSELNMLPELHKSEELLLETSPDIVCDGVCFSYTGDDRIVLKDFTHIFPAGTMTVVMGPTGRGKSTLVRLAMGLLIPEKGGIFFRIDGENHPVSLGNFMYVPQGNSLFSGTIRENLLMADADADDAAIKEVLHVAAADFVLELPDGLDTQCGETGSGLSEGQAQRIAIARALLHKGTVLVMDEATSALDVETEEIFLERLVAKYKGEKTIIFVSHRECAIQYADDILRLN